jgi:hypothetical protein
LAGLAVRGDSSIKWSADCGLDSTGVRWSQIAGFRDHGGESSGFIKVVNVLTSGAIVSFFESWKLFMWAGYHGEKNDYQQSNPVCHCT